MRGPLIGRLLCLYKNNCPHLIGEGSNHRCKFMLLILFVTLHWHTVDKHTPVAQLNSFKHDELALCVLMEKTNGKAVGQVVPLFREVAIGGFHYPFVATRQEDRRMYIG